MLYVDMVEILRKKIVLRKDLERFRNGRVSKEKCFGKQGLNNRSWEANNLLLVFGSPKGFQSKAHW